MTEGLIAGGKVTVDDVVRRLAPGTGAMYEHYLGSLPSDEAVGPGQHAGLAAVLAAEMSRVTTFRALNDEIEMLTEEVKRLEESLQEQRDELGDRIRQLEDRLSGLSREIENVADGQEFGAVCE